MKKYALGLLAIVLAVTVAFTTKPTFNTYQFNGTSTNASHRVDPTKYSPASPACNGTELVLCSINAADNNGRPVIGSAGDALYDNLYNSGGSAPYFLATDIKGYTP